MTPVGQTVVHHFYGCQVTINSGAGIGCFSIKQQLNSGRIKLVLTLSSFVVLLHHCRDCKNCDLKISFIELSHVVCLQWFGMFFQKTVGPFFFFFDVKRLLGMQKPVFLFSTVMNRGLLCITVNF